MQMHQSRGKAHYCEAGEEKKVLAKKTAGKSRKLIELKQPAM
jgi:hypothetical protein